MNANEAITARLDALAAGEKEAWERTADARAKGWSLAGWVEGAEDLLRKSLLAGHALMAKRALDAHGLDGLAAHLDDLTDRLVSGSFLTRSTSLFARAKGEIEAEAVRDLVREMRGLLAFAREAAR